MEGTFAYDNRQRAAENFTQKGYRTFTLSATTNGGGVGFTNNADESMNGNLTASFRKSLRSDLNGRLQLRAQFDQENVTTNSSNGVILAVKDIYTTSNTTTNKNATSSSSVVKNVGYLAGSSLDWKDRYVLDGTFRYDGSSLFGTGNRWAPFGRVSGVWRISQEPWYNVPHLSDFRVRASHGTAGSTPNFSAQYETYNVSNGNITLGTAGNSKLKPETTTEDEFGTDFTLFDRIGIELTYAHDITRDQILQVNTPNSLGFSTQWQNAGTLDNKTYELAASLPVINKKDFQWSMRGTWDRTRTYITEPSRRSTAGRRHGPRDGDVLPHHRESSHDRAAAAEPVWPGLGPQFYRVRTCRTLQAQCGDGKDFQVNDAATSCGSVRATAGATASPRTSGTKLSGMLAVRQRSALLGHADRSPARGQPNEGLGINQIIGNVFPNFRWTYSNNMSYKRSRSYGLFDATIGHEIYNQGEGWGLLDFSSATSTSRGNGRDGQAGRLKLALRPEQSTGIGGSTISLAPTTTSLEDGSFASSARSAELLVGPVRGFGDWTVALVGRNLHTWTKYTGSIRKSARTAARHERAHESGRRVRIPEPPHLHVPTSTRF